MQVKTPRSLINKLVRITLKKLSSALRNISTPVTTNKIVPLVTPSNDGVYLVTTNKTRSFSHILHCLALKSFYHFLIFSLVFNPFAASASEVLPIVVDGTTNTQVTKTASGVDQINIAAPNSSGLSHNRFTHYNINQSGQIINNFSGQNPSEVVIGSGASAVTSTQIGGLVTTNQNLINSGSARVILNEVTSSSNTQLRGYAEIAGTKAELIIANSNGITCLGCGFINTSRLSFIAGSRDSDIDGNLAFKLKEQSNPNLMVPLITISGLGLDVENVTATEIIASSMSPSQIPHQNPFKFL